MFCFAQSAYLTDNAAYPSQLWVLSMQPNAMQANGFFDGIGETIGEAIRVVVEFLLGIFTNFFGAFGDFIDGLTRSLGINDSFFSIAVLVVGRLASIPAWFADWGDISYLIRTVHSFVVNDVEKPFPPNLSS